jgi:hypothetical protein
LKECSTAHKHEKLRSRTPHHMADRQMSYGISGIKLILKWYGIGYRVA